jgi:hypothetical protein
VGYICVIDADTAVLCPTFEFYSSERRAQIHDDSVRYAEMMHDVLDELDGLGYAILDEWFILDPFGELVNGHKNVLETTLGFLRGPT